MPDPIIRTPDQRLRVFVSSTLVELAPERAAARSAVEHLRLVPVMFELGARPHPPQDLYRAYLAQSQVFVGLYWERYGWVAPDMTISGLEDEYRLATEHPKLIYIKEPSEGREPELRRLLDDIRNEAGVSYRSFRDADELRDLIEVDLAVMLTERFEALDDPAEARTERLRLTSVPEPPAAIVGRDVESSAVAELLSRSDVRMVTLVGPGGIGKTRLAVHLGELLRDRFPHGVAFVDLTGARDPALVLSTIARSVGVSEAGSRSVAEALAQVLSGREVLLVVDNFEHVQAAAADLARLLSATTGVKLLVTSREPLHVRWEHEFPMRPLDLPPEEAVGPQALAAVPAVELLVHSAQRVRPSFRVDESNAAAVGEVVRRLEGLPLALELAGARMRLFSPVDMLERMDSPLDLLEGGAADAPERHSSLRSAIAWSHELLSPPEQALFRRLSAFGGGASLDAVEQVCTGEQVPGRELITLLAGLVEKSLIVSDADVAVGPTRFRMLETIREYARERLVESEELEEVRRRHLLWCVRLVGETTAGMWTESMPRWLDLLALELDNLRAALDRAEDMGDWDAGLRIAGDLWPLWDIRGHLREGQRRLSRLIAAAPDSDSSALAGAVLSLGWVTALLGDFDDALVKMRDSVGMFRRVGAPEELAWSLIMAGNVSFNLSLAEETAAYFTEAMEMSSALDAAMCRIVRGWALFGLAHVAFLGGDLIEAERLLDESLVLGREAGVVWGNAWALFSKGILRMLLGDLDAAVGHITESLDGRWLVGDRRGTADCLTLLAVLASMRGDFDESAVLHGTSAVQREATGALVLPWLQDFHAQSLASVRSALGDSRTDELLAAGRSMPLEKAVRAAIADVVRDGRNR